MTADTRTHPASRKRRADLDAIDRLMRERGGLTALPPPTPLHKMGQRPRHESDSGHDARLAPADRSPP